jgi:hypothetical protein
MDKGKTPILLTSVVAMVLLLIASLAGILSNDGGQPYEFASVRDEMVDVYGGQGLYRYDSVYKAAMFRGFDWANLVIVLPLFVLGSILYRRGRVMGQLLLAALFTYLAYIYAIGVMGNAFNAMFLVWTALFSIGILGLFLTLTSLDVASLPENLKANFPQRGLAVYMLVLGVILLFQYLVEVVTAYASGSPPASLDHYTTLELAAFELGIMIPLHFVGGVLLWRKKAWGYVMAILLAFAAAMTFIALSVALLLLYFSFGQGNVPDVALTITLAAVASGFSLVVFYRVKG